MLVAAVCSTAAGVGGAILVARGSFAAGFALLGLSVLALRWPRSIWTAESPDELPRRDRRLALLAICAVAAAFRFYRLEPPGLWGDDAINGLLAFDILDGKVTSPFQIVSHAHSNFHALSNYLIAGAFRLFGPDIWTLRLPGIVVGILCAPLLYATAAPLFGSRTALIAALFYATSPPQISHSKQLIQIMLGEFGQLAGLCLLVRGLANGRRGVAAGAGVPLALCVYTYHAARLAPLVAVFYGLAVWLQPGAPVRESETGTPAHRRTGALLLSTLIVFLLALTPAIVGYIRDPDALVGRVEATSLWPVIRDQHSLWPLWESLWRTLLAVHYQQGPEYHWFGLGFDPAFNVVVGFLLMHGMVTSLLRWREPRHLLLLAWVAVGIVPGVFSGGAPRLYRALLATPPLYIWAAMPLARLLTTALGGWSRRAVHALAALLLVAVPLIDFNYYFYRLYTHPVFHWFQGERIVEMARELRRYGPGWTGYLLSDNFDAHHETFGFLSRAWHLQIVDVASLVDVQALPPARGSALFIMSEADLGAAPALAARYPGGELTLRHEPTLRSWALHERWPLATWSEAPRTTSGFYPVPRAIAGEPLAQSASGLTAEYNFGDHRTTRHEPYPFYYFFPATFPRPFTVRWSGVLNVPSPGGYHLEVETNGAAQVYVDGQRIGADSLLAAGPHEVQFEIADVPNRARLRIYWWQRDAPRALVPPDAFSPPATCNR